MLENFRAGALQRLELVKKVNSFYTIRKWHGVGKAFLLILELSQQQSIFFFITKMSQTSESLSRV